ncbi:MAG TPA: hypothetical protein VLZ33_01370, partial [Dysgonamonadaceae bacterium]|nr:hypothetical protein [Dysgonamonadaceae bacterium]
AGTRSNKLTETNNWGVKFFFPCMDKFTKSQNFIQVLLYLSCATGTAALRNGGFSASYDSFVVGSSAVLRLNFCAKIRHYAKPQTVGGHSKTKTKTNNFNRFVETSIKNG